MSFRNGIMVTLFLTFYMFAVHVNAMEQKPNSGVETYRVEKLSEPPESEELTMDCYWEAEVSGVTKGIAITFDAKTFDAAAECAHEMWSEFMPGTQLFRIKIQLLHVMVEYYRQIKDQTRAAKINYVPVTLKKIRTSLETAIEKGAAEANAEDKRMMQFRAWYRGRIRGLIDVYTQLRNRKNPPLVQDGSAGEDQKSSPALGKPQACSAEGGTQPQNRCPADKAKPPLAMTERSIRLQKRFAKFRKYLESHNGNVKGDETPG